MITILIALGLASSFCVYSLFPFPYISEARIYVRYVLQTTGVSELDTGGKLQTPDDRGSGILNTEVAILTSRSLANQVVKNLGVAAVLGKGDTNRVSEAASFISENLTAGVTKDCDVISVQFKATDPTVVQPVLAELIRVYKTNYFDVHLAPGVSEQYLEKKKDDSYSELETEMQMLTETKQRTGITSLDDAKRDAATLIARTTQNINQTRADLAEATTAVEELQERFAGSSANKSGANRSNELALATPPNADQLSKYKQLNDELNLLRSEEEKLLLQFTTNNMRVQNATHQRETAEANLKAYENENPGILNYKPSDLGKSGAPALDYEAILRDYKTKQHALAAKLKELNTQLAEAHKQASVVDDAERQIMDETSKKEAADAKYKRAVLNADQMSIQAAMGSQVSNIEAVESPTPPGRDMKQMLKATFGVLGFFFVLAFGLPFLIEMVLDQSLKSPMEVQARIGMPFFITLPKTNGHSKLAKLKPAKQVPLLTDQNGATPESGAKEQTLALAKSGAKNGEVAPWDERHQLRPHFETLRDRLMTYFEMINLTHKPKLVAVTSCGPGAGVTTTAAGLASSLSEIGEGNVLLVSMNVGDGEAQHFYKGKLTCGIEEVLEKGNRNQAQVQDNLFVAQETQTDDRLPRVLPKRFSHLVPMLKASDYDYIIFDMPPVSEISITPRLARFMDMVLLVIESEKTSRDAATRVASLLAESKTNVGMVLNKNRSYMPKRLEQAM